MKNSSIRTLILTFNLNPILLMKDCYFPKKKKTAIEKFFDTFLWNAINQRNSDATFSTFQGQCQKQVI